MARVGNVCVGLGLVAFALAAYPQAAADTWLEVRSANFSVVTNTNERKARNIAWQFEQVRAAIALGFPWARVTLDRPLLVIAAKDENTMRALAPMYWKQRGGSRPGSVFASGPDRHYVALRADLEVEEQGMNPYNQAFWAYSALVLDHSTGRALPLWYTNGLSSVLSNTVIREKEIQFGMPIPWHISAMRSGPRLLLPDLLTTSRDSAYYRNGVNRNRFDAQCWSLVQYLQFGRRDGGKSFARLTELLLQGQSSDAAFTEVFGSLAALDEAYTRYVAQPVFSFGRLEVQTDTSPLRMPSRNVGPAEQAAMRAAWHVATNRPVEARAHIADARKLDAKLAGADEAEGLLFDREQQLDQARQSFANAAAAGSASFWTHYRLAALTQGQATPEGRSQLIASLEKATELNTNFAPAFGFLANLHANSGQFEVALPRAIRAAQLDASNVSYRTLTARILMSLSRPQDAQAVLKEALPLARNEQERRSIETLLASIKP